MKPPIQFAMALKKRLEELEKAQKIAQKTGLVNAR